MKLRKSVVIKPVWTLPHSSDLTASGQLGSKDTINEWTESIILLKFKYSYEMYEIKTIII
jgi:hypothetical protein